MTTITGTIQIGEATPTVKSTARRQRGGTWPFGLLLTSLWFGGAVIGFAVAWALGVDRIMGGCVVAVMGILAYRPLCKRLLLQRFRKTLMGKGVPLNLAVRFETSPVAFIYQVGDVQMRAPWRAVSEVFHEKGWWIFMVQSDPWFAADRFFADTAGQRAFVGEVLSHLSDEARARSALAVKFVEAP